MIIFWAVAMLVGILLVFTKDDPVVNILGGILSLMAFCAFCGEVVA